MTLKKLAIASAAAIALSVGAPAPAAFAQAPTAERGIDVPAGPLGAALARFGRQAGVVVTVDPGLVRGRTTAGLNGRYTPEAGLERLLAGSGLRAETAGAGAFRVVAAAPTPVRRGPERPTAPVAEGDAELDDLVIVGKLTDVALTSSDIELRQATDLQDLFRATPSVVVGGGVGIAQKIYVRGLEDSLLNVTVDGAPQRGTLFHHVGRVSLEPELLETAEVQTGAGEATAGFGAIGGAIRFRTRDPMDLLKPGRQFGGMVRASWVSNDAERVSLTGYGRLFGDVGFLASYVNVDRHTFEDGDGNEILGSAAKQELTFLKVGGNLDNGGRFSLSHERRDEKGEFGQRPNWPVLAGDRLFPGKARRDTTTLNYAQPLAAGVSVELTAYRTATQFSQDRYDRWGVYGADIDTRGADLRLKGSWGAHDVVAGVEHRQDEVVGSYRGSPAMWGPWTWDPAVGRFVEKGKLWGAYVQDHWQVTDRLLVSGGLRYDSYDLDMRTYDDGIDSDGFSGNLGFEYALTPELELSVGWAQAFRGKEIGDGFTLERRPGRLALSPNLKPEKVDNFEAGVSYARQGFTASVVYFDMKIDDVVLDQLGRGPVPQDTVYYENVGGYRSDGIEVKAGYQAETWGVDAFYTTYDARLNGRRIEGYEQVALGNSMGDSWNLTGRWSPTETLDFSANLTRFNALNGIEVLYREVELGFIDGTRFVDKPGYTVLDLFARWRPFADDRIELLAAVYNVFDKSYRAHASVADYSGIPGYGIVRGVREPGRNVRLTVAVAY